MSGARRVLHVSSKPYLESIRRELSSQWMLRTVLPNDLCQSSFVRNDTELPGQTDRRVAMGDEQRYLCPCTCLDCFKQMATLMSTETSTRAVSIGLLLNLKMVSAQCKDSHQ